MFDRLRRQVRVWLSHWDPILIAILEGFLSSITRSGPLFVLLASILISACVIVHVGMLLPTVAPPFSGLFFFHLGLSGWILCMICFHYACCVLTPPGSPQGLEDGGRICQICNKSKPERTHHCIICNKCVLKMDHHCPWMSNCIGHNNVRYFFLFLFFLWIGCGYFCSLAALPFWVGAQISTRKWNTIYPNMPKPLIEFTFVLALSMFLSLTFFISWNLFLIFSSQTTIEYHANRAKANEMRKRGETFVNEYNLGMWNNLKIFFNVCEQYPWWFMLLPVRVPPVGDGAHFPSRSSQAKEFNV